MMLAPEKVIPLTFVAVTPDVASYTVNGFAIPLTLKVPPVEL